MKINFKFDDKLEKAGLKVVKLLKQNNYQAFWVGGVVRNILLKRQSDNMDIATDALPDDVEKVLEKSGIKNKPVGKKFGSILAIVNKFPVEITTFRSEGRYSDNRHPDQVLFIKEYLNDAKRRDFTINALYFDPIKKELYDPTKGIKDLGLKLLRFVGDPKKRIDEDALRMLRGMRLATQLGFKLERNSFAAIKTRAKYIQGISGERIKAELDKILLSENRVVGVRLLDETGLLRFIIPEMEPLKKFSHKSKLYHLEGTTFEHTLLALSNAGKADLNLLYALLFHDIGKPLVPKKVFKNDEWVISTRGHAEVSAEIFDKFAKKMKFSTVGRNTINWLIKNHMLMTVFGEMSMLKQYALAGHPDFELLLKHWECDERACKRADNQDMHTRKYRRSKLIVRDLLEKISRTKILVKKLSNGNLIMKYGKLKPGQALGQKIQDIKARVVLGKIKNRNDLKSYLE